MPTVIIIFYHSEYYSFPSLVNGRIKYKLESFSLYKHFLSPCFILDSGHIRTVYYYITHHLNVQWCFILLFCQYIHIILTCRFDSTHILNNSKSIFVM